MCHSYLLNALHRTTEILKPLYMLVGEMETNDFLLHDQDFNNSVINIVLE